MAERNNLKEFIINFALIYSFIVGTTLVIYSMSRGLFSFLHYVSALILFIGYLCWWVYDKKRMLNKQRTAIGY